MAQASTNDGRPSIVVGVGPEVADLGGILFPDQAGSAQNPTLVMVTPSFVLDPGTFLQGFRGQPARFFSVG